MLGFKIDESMRGSHHFVAADGEHHDRPLCFSLTWGNRNIFRWLNPFSGQFLFNEARGMITVDGLARKADCTGSLHLLYFTQRKIRYVLNFKGDDGRSYRYVGEKINLWPWNLHKTHVTCYGTITDQEADRKISESVVYFPYRQIIPFMLSFRFRLGGVFKYA